MYLPSKIKLKILVLAALVGFLFFLPFKGVFQSLLSFLSHQLTVTPQESFQQIKKFEKENITLQLQLETSQILKAENQRLKSILDFRNEEKIDLIGANVISFSPSSWRRYLLIDAGKDRGVKEGLLVVDEKGKLIGKVSETKATHAGLTLVNDPNFSLAVFVGESASGLLRGNLTGAKILYIEDADNVKVNDRVWVKVSTQPSSITIGEVASVKKSKNQLFCDIKVSLSQPGAFFKQVFIIK